MPLQPVRRAVIDVGTNSVKLLVAEISGRDIRPLLEESDQTRLGRGFYETHRLQPDAIAATARAIARFQQLASVWQAGSPRVIATSAARDALNSSDLTAAIATSSGLRLEIISGQQEAQWVFQGISSDPRLTGLPLLMIDVGGGSTEFIAGHDDSQSFRQSFPLGTVRLMDKFPVSDPPLPRELEIVQSAIQAFLTREVAPLLHPVLDQLSSDNAQTVTSDSIGLRDQRGPPHPSGVGPQLVATGGTAVIMARIHLGLDAYDRDKIDATTLGLPDVRQQVARLWSQPVAARRTISGLPAGRADVILMGGVIVQGIMETFRLPALRPSSRGLRYAALLETPA